MFDLEHLFSKRYNSTFSDGASFSVGLAERATASRELFAKASFKFLPMTSESGVLSFLFFLLGPPGVSKAANASYMYKGREWKQERGERKEEEKTKAQGRRGEGKKKN